MRRSTQRQPLSPRDFATQAGEIESELRLAREVRDLWLSHAKGLGKDRTAELQRQVNRLQSDLDDLRRRARRTDSNRRGGSAGGGSGTVGQAWGD